MINKQLAPFADFPRITRIEDLEPLEVTPERDFPEILERIDVFPEWLDCDESLEEHVANNIEDTINSIHESLVYKRKYTK